MKSTMHGIVPATVIAALAGGALGFLNLAMTNMVKAHLAVDPETKIRGQNDKRGLLAPENHTWLEDSDGNRFMRMDKEVRDVLLYVLRDRVNDQLCCEHTQELETLLKVYEKFTDGWRFGAACAGEAEDIKICRCWEVKS